MTYYIIIRGPLGCGKSTIAKKVAQEIKAKYFSVDKVLEENNLEDDREEGYISQKSFLKANEILAEKSIKFLNSETPVVFDGNFYWKSQIEDLISRLKFKNSVFTLKAPLEVCIERDKGRGVSYGNDAAEAVYKKTAEFDYGTVIDLTKTEEECVKKIISYLSKWKTK
ncbi:AAA family ATPase [Candidatus Woesearchaeota archaeon]|nr:AAA family ATPase [Candidatus Woesearchaeota archaeon]